MEKYEVTFRSRVNGNRWSIMVRAVDFADAEKQALPYKFVDNEIISIEKDYDS